MPLLLWSVWTMDVFESSCMPATYYSKNSVFHVFWLGAVTVVHRSNFTPITVEYFIEEDFTTVLSWLSTFICIVCKINVYKINNNFCKVSTILVKLSSHKNQLNYRKLTLTFSPLKDLSVYPHQFHNQIKLPTQNLQMNRNLHFQTQISIHSNSGNDMLLDKWKFKQGLAFTLLSHVSL